MDHTTKHVVERMAQRLGRTIAGPDYESLCRAALKHGVPYRHRTDVSWRVVLWKRKYIVVILCERYKRVLTCWKAGRKQRTIYDAFHAAREYRPEPA